MDLVVSSDNYSGEKMEADVLVFINPQPDRQSNEPWAWHKANRSILLLPHINDMEIADMDNDGDLNIVGPDTYASGAKPWIYENLNRNR